MTKKITMTVLSLISAVAFSQQVLHGKVQDRTGRGISEVSVNVVGSETIVVTDTDGKFSVEIPAGKSILSFNAQSYAPFSRSVTADSQNILVVLKDDTREISELVISAEKALEVNKLKLKNLEAPMTTNVLNNAVLQKWNITTFEEASKMVAGINSVKQYGGFQFFNIRGFDNTVVLYDGMRDERHSFFTSAPMPNIANIERMEVLKGPSGEMFGHSALGGIINIVRKRPTYTTQGDAKFTIGSYNTYNANVGIGGPISDQIRYRIDLGTLNTDGFKGIRENSNNASVMVEYTPDEKNTFEAFYQLDKNFFGADTGVPANNNGTPISWIDPLFNYANNQDYLKYDKHEAYLNYRYKHSTDYQLNLRLSYLNDEYDYLMDEVLFVDDSSKKVSRRNAGGYHFRRITELIMGTIDHHFKYEINGIKNKAVVGNILSFMDKPSLYGDISVGADDMNIGELGLGQKSVKIAKRQSLQEATTAMYAQNWTEFTDRFRLLLGLRYDYLFGKYDYEKREIEKKPEYDRVPIANLTYRGALSYQVVENTLNSYISASSFFKPKREHNHKSGEILKPETGYQVEGGIKYENKNKVNAGLAIFYIQKDNIVVGHNVREQVGQATSSGLELDVDAEIVRGLYAKVNYAFTNARFSSGAKNQNQNIGGNRLQFSPEYTFNTWLNYEPQKFKGFGVGVGAVYIGKTFQNQFNTQYLPAHILLNGTVYYQAKNGIRLGLNVDNILNKLQYINALSSNDLWVIDSNDERYQSSFQVVPNKLRNLRLSVSYKF